MHSIPVSLDPSSLAPLMNNNSCQDPRHETGAEARVGWVVRGGREIESGVGEKERAV